MATNKSVTRDSAPNQHDPDGEPHFDDLGLRRGPGGRDKPIPKIGERHHRVDSVIYAEMVAKAIATLGRSIASHDGSQSQIAMRTLQSMIGPSATEGLATSFGMPRWQCSKCGAIRTRYYFSDIERGICTQCGKKS